MRLVLLRHAKSDWPAGVLDIDRPLAPRGIRDCDAVAEYLEAQPWHIDQAIVSPAMRTQETFARVSAKLSYPIEHVIDARIYEASVASLLNVVNELVSETAVLVGHGPGLPGLAASLADEHSFANVALLRLKYPTAAIAVLESQLPWDQWRAKSARLTDFVVPHGNAD